MSLVSQEKAEVNFCKFIENTRRLIGSTKNIIDRINEENVEIRNNYSDVPSLLQMALDLLSNCGINSQKNLMKTFIFKSIEIWELIRLKDDTVLTEHLSKIIPDNPYVVRIQYVYGSNPSNKCFVDKIEIKKIWNLITALVHNSIKYILFSGDSKYDGLLPRNVVSLWKVNLE